MQKLLTKENKLIIQFEFEKQERRKKIWLWIRSLITILNKVISIYNVHCNIIINNL